MGVGVQDRDAAAPAWSRRWLYLHGVTAVGLSTLLAIAVTLHADGLAKLGRAPGFWLLVLLVCIGEIRPILLTKASVDNSVFASTTFVFAALLQFGLPAAVLLHTLGTLLAGVVAGRTGNRMAFNVGQYVLSLTAAAMVLNVDGGHVSPSGGWLLTMSGSWAVELVVVIAAMLAYFVVNYTLVTVAVALIEGTGIVELIRQDLGFEVVASGTLLGLAPLVGVVLHYIPILVPLFLVPLLAAYAQAKVLKDRDHHAYHDTLTGLPNRKLLVARTQDALDEAVAVGWPGRPVAARPRPFQGHQRHPGARHGRPGASAGCRPARRKCASAGHGGPARRRRVRRAATGDSATLTSPTRSPIGCAPS